MICLGRSTVLLTGMRYPMLPRMCMRLLMGIRISGATSQFVRRQHQVPVGNEFGHRRPSAAKPAVGAEGLADSCSHIKSPWRLVGVSRQFDFRSELRKLSAGSICP